MWCTITTRDGASTVACCHRLAVVNGHMKWALRGEDRKKLVDVVELCSAYFLEKKLSQRLRDRGVLNGWLYVSSFGNENVHNLDQYQLSSLKTYRFSPATHPELDQQLNSDELDAGESFSYEHVMSGFSFFLGNTAENW